MQIDYDALRLEAQLEDGECVFHSPTERCFYVQDPNGHTQKQLSDFADELENTEDYDKLARIEYEDRKLTLGNRPSVVSAFLLADGNVLAILEDGAVFTYNVDEDEWSSKESVPTTNADMTIY